MRHFPIVVNLVKINVMFCVRVWMCLMFNYTGDSRIVQTVTEKSVKSLTQITFHSELIR